ncbi:MAG: SBBP repeat-containing protein [Acidobacteriota bacterium]
MRHKHSPVQENACAMTRMVTAACVVLGLLVAAPPDARGDPPARSARGAVNGRANPHSPLVADGELVWNTFLGGADYDEVWAIAVDSAGCSYVVGRCGASWGSPVRPYTASLDGFVAKIDAHGALLWNTFLGGSSYDSVNRIALDGAGNVYVVGDSQATWGLPLRPYTAMSDAFAAKLTPSGALLWSTFLGGSANDGGYGIAVDSAGSPCVAGTSGAAWGSPVRPYTANQDGFVARLDTNGSILWNSFMGGGSWESCSQVALNGSGAAYVLGQSPASWGSPVRPYTGGDDMFAAELDAGGSLVWNTFLGGGGSDRAGDIAVNAGGVVSLVGTSDASWGSPVRPYSADKDAVAVRLNAATRALVWSTFLGGGGDDRGWGIALDSDGNAYVAGPSATAWGTPVRPYSGYYDAVATKLDVNGAVVWNSFLGSVAVDAGTGVALNGTGDVYVAGHSEATWGAPASPYTGNTDGFVAKLAHVPPGPTITQIKSEKATRGSAATIIGTGFSTKKTDNVVYFGKKKADVKRARTTRLQVTIPNNCKKGKNNVYVVVKSVKSNVMTFTVKK